ncbi:MAG: hypothetical protein NVS9B3_15110 [Gemmatimonadaceae bacterium]
MAVVAPRGSQQVAFGALAALAALSLCLALPAAAQSSARADTTKPVDAERRAQMERRGGGLRVGTFNPNGLTDPTGSSSSTSPVFEGYVRTGLDLHLVLENSVGVWRRSQTVTQTTNGLTGSTTTTETRDTYIIPQLTSVVFYPATAPDDAFEPYVGAGIGFALGVDDRKGGGSTSLFGGSSGVSLSPGLGAQTGLGVEYRFTQALGAAVGGRYQYIRFLQDVGGRDTYQGLGATVGLTYRFQFR